jgi:hypothetical protein
MLTLNHLKEELKMVSEEILAMHSRINRMAETLEIHIAITRGPMDRPVAFTEPLDPRTFPPEDNMTVAHMIANTSLPRFTSINHKAPAEAVSAPIRENQASDEMFYSSVADTEEAEPEPVAWLATRGRRAQARGRQAQDSSEDEFLGGRTSWLPEEIVLLRQYAADGRSDGWIARALQKSEVQVLNKRKNEVAKYKRLRR